MNFRILASMALVALMFLSCEDHHDDHHHEDALQEFVEDVETHFTGGPFDTITTATEADAPDASEEETCYVIVGGADTYISYIAAAEAGETEIVRTLFLNTDTITPVVSSNSIESVHTFDFDEVTTTVIKSGLVYHFTQTDTLKFKLSGLAAGDTVKAVFAHGEGDAHDHD